MNYENLSDAERIDKATEHAYSLVTDYNDADTIVQELTGEFGLTREQSIQAFNRMQQGYNDAYEQTISRYNLIVLGTIAFSLAVAIIYYLLPAAMNQTVAGILLLILAVASLLVAAIVGVRMVVVWEEKRRYPIVFRPRLFFIGEREEVLWHTWKLLPLAAGFLVLACLPYLTDQGVIHLPALETSEKKVLYTQPYRVKLSNTRNPSYGYVFSFIEDPHVYRLPVEFTNYHSAAYHISDLSVGDSMQIVYDRADLAQITQRGESNKIHIYNFVKDDMPYIDLEQRNEAINQKNKGLVRQGLLGWLIASLVTIGMLIWQVVRFRRRAQSSKANYLRDTSYSL